MKQFLKALAVIAMIVLLIVLVYCMVSFVYWVLCWSVPGSTWGKLYFV